MHYVLSVARLCERMRKLVAIKTKRVWHAAHFCSETRSVQTSVSGCFERVLKWVASGIQYILQLTNNLYLHSTPKYVSTRTRCDRAALAIASILLWGSEAVGFKHSNVHFAHLYATKRLTKRFSLGS